MHCLSKATLLGLIVVQDRHTQMLWTAGHDCRIIIGLFSIYYKNILRNKTCILGLIFHMVLLQQKIKAQFTLSPPYLSGDPRLDAATVPKNRLFTYITTGLLRPEQQQFLLFKESRTSQWKVWMRDACLLSSGSSNRSWLGHHSWSPWTSQQSDSQPQQTGTE